MRSIYADRERGDFGRADWADPDIEFVFGVDLGVLPGTRTGLVGMAEAYREWLSAWEHARVVAEDFREIDDERILVLDRSRARGTRSGLELEHIERGRSATVFHVREGKVTKLVIGTRERALADLGLAPEASSPDS